jgi:hypothetical protein
MMMMIETYFDEQWKLPRIFHRCTGNGARSASYKSFRQTTIKTNDAPEYVDDDDDDKL